MSEPPRFDSRARVPPGSACRCGWNGEGEHPCHGRGYSCRQPAKLRFYGGKVVGVAGVQAKVQAAETWACDGCWEIFGVMP